MKAATEPLDTISLMDRLSDYPHDAVRDVLERVGPAVGDSAKGVDPEQQALWVALTVLDGRARDTLYERIREIAAPLLETDHSLWIGDGAGRIVAVSHAGAAIVGREPEELIGAPIEILAAPGQNWGELREISEANGGRLVGATLWQHKDGTIIPVAFQMRPITLAGTRLSLVAVRPRKPIRLTPDAGARARRALSDGLDRLPAVAGGLYACLGFGFQLAGLV